MPSPHLLPTLCRYRDSVLDLQAKIERTDLDPDVSHLEPGLRLAAGTVLPSVAKELQGQIETANRPFTVATVGAFKVGKSTMLNALLGLRGDARLSDQDTPDTACSVLLRFRTPADPEARIRYLDGSTEDTTWAEAKRLTSQVWLNAHPVDAQRSAKVEEVEYFVANPVLAQLNLNDLPGTGSRYWREHSELTHRKMKEADAILWIVGEDEPSADDRVDLSKLAECRRGVYPIVNVLEDPSLRPPLPRDDERVRLVVASLMRDFRHFFADDVERPIEASAKVADLERANDRPDERVLRESGLLAVLTLLEQLLQRGDATDARSQRIRNTTVALATRVRERLTELSATVREAVSTAQAAAGASALMLDEADATRLDVRSRVRTLARDQAQKIGGIISAQARTFIEDKLQLSNVEAMGAALSHEGRTRLSESLKDEFLQSYLQLHRTPNWLEAVGRTFAEDVAAVTLPAWRRLAREAGTQADGAPGSTVAPDIDLSKLGDAMLHGVVAAVLKILGILGVAGLLAMIPGGVVIDAVGVVGLIILSAFTDPLAGPRARAVNRAQLQVEAQEYEVMNGLVDAGMTASGLLEARVREVLRAKEATASRGLTALHDINRAIADLNERTETTIAAMDPANGRS